MFVFFLLGLVVGARGQTQETASGETPETRSPAAAAARVQQMVVDGNDALNGGDYFRAAVLFESAYRLGATNEGLAATLGNLWYVQADFGQALAWYDEAIRTAEGNTPDLWVKRLEVLYRMDDYEGVLAAGRKILAEANPGTGREADVQALMGYAAFQSGNPEQAVAFWQQALKDGCEDTSILRFLGAYYFKKENYARSLTYLDAYAKQFPDNRDFARQRVICLLKLDRLGEAEKAMVSYLEHFAGEKKTDDLLDIYLYAPPLDDTP